MYYYLALTKTFEEETSEKYRHIFEELMKTNSSFAEAVEESKKYDKKNNQKNIEKETIKKEQPKETDKIKNNDKKVFTEEEKQKLKEELLNEEEKPGRFDYVCENPGIGFKILQFMASAKFTVFIFLCSIAVSGYMLYTQRSLDDMKNSFKK
jgi:hypothetical protein